MAVFALVRWVSLARSQDAREAEQYPQKAVAFLRTGDHPGKIFVYYDWGGYAIWKLYPEYRVFVDGRADLYGDDLLGQFTTAVQLRTGWREVLDSWKVEAVLVPPACALAQALLLDPNWHTAFSDSKAILLVRTQAAVENAGHFSRDPLPANRRVRKVKKCFPEPSRICETKANRDWFQSSSQIGSV